MNGAKDFRIEMAVLAFVLTLSLFLAGFYAYRTYGVDVPLTRAVQAVSGVEKVELERIDKTTVLTIRLNERADLKQAYGEAQRLAGEYLGDKPYVVEVKDSPGPELTGLYRELELAVYEGMAKNSFLWLAHRMKEEAVKIGAVSQLQIDEANVYITLRRGENTLYRVLKRQADSVYTGQGGKTE